MPTANLPSLVHTVADLRAALDPLRRGGRRIGLVPTMGALHEGHLSLVRNAQRECDFTVVTIFVNPTQFGPNEDFSRYPRTLPADLELLAGCRTDVVFAPSAEEMYARGYSTWVEVESVAVPWEGPCRPGHFRGVATVVLKLFLQSQADVAFFGRKDYQQTCVIRRMVADLDVPIQIRVCPTVREADGLAMSSRNRYLRPEARQRALALWRSLCAAQELAAAGQRDPAAVSAHMRGILEAAGGQIDYIGLADADTLDPVAEIHANTIALLAVRIDGTRLIDNARLFPVEEA